MIRDTFTRLFGHFKGTVEIVVSEESTSLGLNAVSRKSNVRRRNFHGEDQILFFKRLHMKAVPTLE